MDAKQTQRARWDVITNLFGTMGIFGMLELMEMADGDFNQLSKMSDGQFNEMIEKMRFFWLYS